MYLRSTYQELETDSGVQLRLPQSGVTALIRDGDLPSPALIRGGESAIFVKASRAGDLGAVCVRASLIEDERLATVPGIRSI